MSIPKMQIQIKNTTKTKRNGAKIAYEFSKTQIYN